MKSPSSFDDFLSLGQRDLSACRLLVLGGISGSGKTTAMRWLLAHHPDYRDRPVQWLTSRPLRFDRTPACELLVLDELVRWQDLLLVRRLLRQGHRLLVASHLPLWLHALAAPGGQTVCLRTDRQPAKLETYLQRQGVSYNEAALRYYRHRHGLSYGPLQIMLSHTGLADLSQAMALFDRNCHLHEQVLR